MTSTTTPEQSVLVDAGDRARIAAALDATLVVEAGAGTGKTAALVGRILALLSSGRAELREIAAITFTEAAAAELRERLLESLLASGDPRLRRSIDQLEEAAITTIHGFAQRLLAEHPLEAGLPLRFRVLDEIAASIEAERRLSSFLDSFFDEPATRSLAGAAILLGVLPIHLRGLLRVMEDAWHDLAPENLPNGSSGRTQLDERVDAVAEAVRAELNEVVGLITSCRDPEDALAVRIGELEAELARYRSTDDWLDRLRWLVELRPQRVGQLGRRDAWSDIESARLAIGQYEDRRAEGLELVSDAVLRALGGRLGDEVRAQVNERRTKGELTFHDLLVHARDLLAGNGRVRRALQSRLAYLLVDEFQDTDPLQLEILLLLGSVGSNDRLVPGKLFFVGDPNQSIYRFRRADIELYERTIRRVVGDERVRLRTNFRSDPGILDWVNGTFSELFSAEGADDLAAFGFTPLAPGRDPTGSPPVLLLGGPSEGLSAPERRQREAAELAEVIATAVADGWLIHDADGVRPAGYGDIAVLVPRRTGLVELETALEELAIPYVLESSSLVYQSEEVRDLLACLRAIDRPGDELAVVAALRTPAFACGDDELLAYRQAHGEWRLGSKPPPGLEQHPVAVGLAALAEYRGRRHEVGVDGLVGLVVKGQSMLQLVTGLPRGREALRRLDFVVDQARAFIEAGGTSLRELLEWMELQGSLQTRNTEPQRTVGEEAVRILTVHGAKGLEFPIVVLAELGGAPRGGLRGPSVVRSEEGAIELSISAKRRTAGFSVLAEREAERDRAEQLRLAYVAATRAKDHLIVSLYHAPSASPVGRSLAEALHLATQSAPGSVRRAAPRSLGQPRHGPSSRRSGDRWSGGGPAATREGMQRWIAARDDLFRQLARPRHIAASELGAPGEPERHDGARATDRGEGLDPLARSRRRGASRLGRAVHATLEAVELDGGTDLEACARTSAVAEGCPDRLDRVIELAKTALASDVIAEARAASSRWRELPVAAQVGEIVLEGVIDLCYAKGDGLVVVDYKTDSLQSPAAARAAADRYRIQAGAYALALAEAGAPPVRRFVFVFLAPPDRAIEHEVEDLAEAVAAARSSLVALEVRA